jgi:cell division septation protein DedD
VLIVPEVVHGRRSHAGRPMPASAAPAATTRTYTIELGNPSVSPPSPASRTDAPEAAPVSPVTPVAPFQAQAQAQAQALGSALPSPPAPAKPVPAPKATAATATPRAPATVVSRHQTSRTSAHGGGWSVQLGLFAREGNARRLAHTAQGKGIAVDVTRFGTRGLYRVAVAGLADRAAAEQIAHRLHGAGLPAAILGPR